MVGCSCVWVEMDEVRCAREDLIAEIAEQAQRAQVETNNSGGRTLYGAGYVVENALTRDASHKIFLRLSFYPYQQRAAVINEAAS